MNTTATQSKNPLCLALTGQLNTGEKDLATSKEWRQSLTVSVETQLARTAKPKVAASRFAPVVNLKKPVGAISDAVQRERQQALGIYAEIREIFPGYGRLGRHARRAGLNILQLPGTGASNFPSLSKAELKPLVWERLSEWIKEVNLMRELEKALEAAVGDTSDEAAENMEPAKTDPANTETEQPRPSNKTVDPSDDDEALGTTLFEATRGVKDELAGGKFEAARNRRFLFPKAQFVWVVEIGKNQELLKQLLESTKGHADIEAQLLELTQEAVEDFKRLGKFCPAAQSLLDNLMQTDALYVQLLPDLLKMLEGMYPEMPEETLIEVAAQAIDQELAIRHYVFWVWADIFAQDRDRCFVKERASIDDFINGCFELLIRTECGENGDTCRKLLATMNAGGLFKCHFEADGPSTLPAQVLQAKGPSGDAAAHAINIPFDMEKMIEYAKVIFAHEFMHDMFSDIKGLEEELEKVGDRALVAAFKKKEGENGRLVLSSKTVMIGKQRIPTIKLLRSIFADTLNEMNADVSGGILLTGPAFVEGMIVIFKALYGPVLDRYGMENKFPNDTIYTTDAEGNIEVEVHFQPLIRSKMVAKSLAYQGFEKEARYYSRLADQATEMKLVPKVATWRHSEGVYPNIELQNVDLEAASEIYVKAIMETKLKSLNGRSMKQLINWTRGRQQKVDVLAKILCGELTMDDLPKGSIYETYIAAASVVAYRRLLQIRDMTGPMAMAHLRNEVPKLRAVAIKGRPAETEAACCQPKSAA